MGSEIFFDWTLSVQFERYIWQHLRTYSEHSGNILATSENIFENILVIAKCKEQRIRVECIKFEQLTLFNGLLFLDLTT